MNGRIVSKVASVIVLLCQAVWLGCGGCAKEPSPPVVRRARAPERLTIITPHNAKIREAFEIGFSDWYLANRGVYAQIDWIVRGTPQCVDYIQQTFSGDSGRRLHKTPDLMFGGGIADHRLLAKRGHSQTLNLDDALADIPAEVNGLPTRDVEGCWFATGLSSFGIVYNARDCRQRGIAAPTTWADLADPRFRGWVGVADPAASGSHRQSMMLILQNQGWEQGWATLVRILGNARALVDSSTDVLNQVGSGVFLAGFAVNFDGLARVDESNGVLGYVNPPGATAVTPDVTTVLKTAGNVRLAEDFVRYCLSEAGQVAWGVKTEHRNTDGATLYHYPIDPQVYEAHAGQLAVTENPFKTDFGLRLDLEKANRQAAALIPLVRSAGGENHILLQQAWEAVVDSGMKPQALAELCKPPVDEETAYQTAQEHRGAGPTEARRLEQEWSNLFREKFARVIELAKG